MQSRYNQSTTVARPVAPKGKRKGERPVEKPVEFILNSPQARAVAVAGAFNDWDVKRTPLRQEAGGSWKTTVWLPTGRYEYRFIVDGQWISDPSARETTPNAFGSTNSIVVV
jgi:1,4-alpha-glucan branching enzyme